jgi:hypothetical protein
LRGNVTSIHHSSPKYRLEFRLQAAENLTSESGAARAAQLVMEGGDKGDAENGEKTSHAADSYFDYLIRRHVHVHSERRWLEDAYACILASCRYIHQTESFSRERASLILRQLPVRPPRTIFLQWRGEVAHVNVLLHVRCGHDSLISCRLTSSGDVRAAASLLWARAIIARVHLRHRRRMMETLVALKESVAYNGYAYKTLACHDPHDSLVGRHLLNREVIRKYGKHGNMYSVDGPWELCPNTSDARFVCARYPWAAHAIVFADGSSYFTKQAQFCFDTAQDALPGCQTMYTNCLKQEGGKYGVDVFDDEYHFFFFNVLLRSRLPD